VVQTGGTNVVDEPDPSAKTDLLFALADAREKVGWHGPPQIVDAGFGTVDEPPRRPKAAERARGTRDGRPALRMVDRLVS
jgi:hypothetical protein